jgi:hypothetical protein
MRRVLFAGSLGVASPSQHWPPAFAVVGETSDTGAPGMDADFFVLLLLFNMKVLKAIQLLGAYIWPASST